MYFPQTYAYTLLTLFVLNFTQLPTNYVWGNLLEPWPAMQSCHHCSQRGMVSGLMLCHLDGWGKCQWLMMESLSGTDDGWQCQWFIKGQMTCCRGRQWHCLVPEAFRFSFTMFLLKKWVGNNISRSFPCYSLIVLPTPRGCFFSYLNSPFPSKDATTLRSDSVVCLEVC